MNETLPPLLPTPVAAARRDVYQAAKARCAVEPGSDEADDAATLASISFPKRLAAWVGICVLTFTTVAVATDKPAFLTEGKGYEVTPINIVIFFVVIGFFLMLQARQVAPKVPADVRGPMIILLAVLSVLLPALLYIA